MKTALKLLIFVALMGSYWLFDGFHLPSDRSMRRLFFSIDAVYFVGAIIAVTMGDETIGTLDPISLRPIFIILGSLLMIFAFSAMIATRDERLKQKRPNPATALWLPVRPLLVRSLHLVC